MLNKPIKFVPYYKTVIWGGNKIDKLKNTQSGLDNVGESWEISTVVGHESEIVDPEQPGDTLCTIINRYGADLLGREVMQRTSGKFPLLIKIIDATDDLSLQVHPDDDLAMERHGSSGKAEMWYILDAESGAKIYTGLCAPLSPADYRRRVADNTIMDVVAAHESHPGQFYFVPAGTLHSIGAGNLLVEVQQSSDITYRVYDFDRRDANGNPRELHVDLAADAIDYTYPHTITPTAQTYDCTTANVVECEHFCTTLLKLGAGDTVTIDNGGDTFAVLIVTEGTMTITASDGKQYTVDRGNSVLLPAAMDPAVVSGDGCTALLVTC